jgi:tRNA threonylcarbamoyladenosine biosynthesis protein TsaB
MGLVLAFDTATHVATVAVLRDEETLGQCVSQAWRVLLDAHDLLAAAGAGPTDVERIVVGTGPGSFTGLRIGIAAARGLAIALDIPVAGVRTLDALAAGAPGALPVVDAGRREVFTIVSAEPRALAASEIELDPGTTCVGDGALRYRTALEASGGYVPPDDSDVHVPHAWLHASLAREFGSADLVVPVYVRPPDATVVA